MNCSAEFLRFNTVDVWVVVHRRRLVVYHHGYFPDSCYLFEWNQKRKETKFRIIFGNQFRSSSAWLEYSLGKSSDYQQKARIINISKNLINCSKVKRWDNYIYVGEWNRSYFNV